MNPSAELISIFMYANGCGGSWVEYSQAWRNASLENRMKHSWNDFVIDGVHTQAESHMTVQEDNTLPVYSSQVINLLVADEPYQVIYTA